MNKSFFFLKTNTVEPTLVNFIITNTSPLSPNSRS